MLETQRKVVKENASSLGFSLLAQVIPRSKNCACQSKSRCRAREPYGPGQRGADAKRIYDLAYVSICDIFVLSHFLAPVYVWITPVLKSTE